MNIDAKSTQLTTLQKDSLLELFSDEIRLNNDSSQTACEERSKKINVALGKRGNYNMIGLAVGDIGFYELSYEHLIRADYAKRMKAYTDSANQLNSSNNSDSISLMQNVALDSLLKLEKINRKYFITLTFYRLDYDAWFFVKDMKSYIEYYKTDSVSTTNKNRTYATKMYKETPLLFLTEDLNISPGKHQLCLPISKKTFEIGKNVATSFYFLLIGIGIFMAIVLPIKLLMNIANGKAFIQTNINYLNIIGYWGLSICILSAIFPYCIHLFVKNQIPSQFVLTNSFTNTLINNMVPILISIMVLAVAKAFKKGMLLQTQTDLTI